MKAFMILLKKITAALREFALSGGERCSKCGVCHHVCGLIDPKNPPRAREE